MNARRLFLWSAHDAWNRLVKVTGQDADLVIQSSAYDALGRVKL